MSTARKKKSNAELLAEAAQLPEGVTAEVIGGELYVMGRPSAEHQNVERRVGIDLDTKGSGPPDGWLILPEVEVQFSTDERVAPDISGWRWARITGRHRENPITVTPDWACEILSDSTRRKDLGPKRDLYARQGIPHLWIIDPAARVLEAFALEKQRWLLLGTWSDKDIVPGIAPFSDATLDLGRWWLPA